MLLAAVKLVLSPIIILGANPTFTNAVEIRRECLDPRLGAVGSILVVRTRDPASSSSAYHHRNFYREEEE